MRCPIIYTPDGQVSAHVAGADGYFGYAGTFEWLGDRVVHRTLVGGEPGGLGRTCSAAPIWRPAASLSAHFLTTTDRFLAPSGSGCPSVRPQRRNVDARHGAPAPRRPWQRGLPLPGSGRRSARCPAPLVPPPQRGLGCRPGRVPRCDRPRSRHDRSGGGAYGYGPVRPALLEHSQPDPLPYGAVPLAHFAVSVALTRVLAASEIVPRLIVGHSLGEYAALVCAGAFTLAEGARLVCALNDAYRDVVGRGGLVLVDAGESDTEALLVGAGRTNVAVACVNSPRQAMVSGPTEALDARSPSQAPPFPGCGASPFPTRPTTPRSSPFTTTSGVGWQICARGTCASRSTRPGARPHRQRRPDYGPRRLLHQAVRFTDALGRLTPLDERLLVEAGVGDSLSACVRAALPGARTVAPSLTALGSPDTCSPALITAAR
ncbi:acyltransferase domain-containing protein [Streptomyces rishiriensis]|uniref:acyltransferase domain-containing protein n=1 Tax=Streptomyces rishiriensis TaxID=68264 RepID=UPI0035A23AF0